MEGVMEGVMEVVLEGVLEGVMEGVMEGVAVLAAGRRDAVTWATSGMHLMHVGHVGHVGHAPHARRPRRPLDDVDYAGYVGHARCVAVWPRGRLGETEQRDWRSSRAPCPMGLLKELLSLC
jgi:hypothetical protein